MRLARPANDRWLWLLLILAVSWVAAVLHPSAAAAQTGASSTAGDAFNQALRKAIRGDIESQFFVGLSYYSGLGVAKDQAEAAKWYRKAAEQGHGVAQLQIGNLYHNGQGVAQDFVEAHKWLSLAAAQGNKYAQNNLTNLEPRMTAEQVAEAQRLARAFVPGKGGLSAAESAASESAAPIPKGSAQTAAPPAHEEAIEELLRQANQGDAAAQTLLGLKYDNGEGVQKNPVEAVKWYRKAAEQGYRLAQSLLGIKYDNGEGVPKNPVEAVRWYREAAEQGEPGAQSILGGCYSEGHVVSKDQAEAAKWYRKAAEQGYPAAQLDLGALYANGRGVPKDFVQAYFWWILAAAQGQESARENATKLERRMTADQIAEGQRLAREFVPRKEQSASADSSPFASPTPGPKANGRELTDAEVGLAPFASPTPRPKANGTGFFITEDGYLVSNQHVVEEGARVRLVTAQGTVPAVVVRVDAANDLALLKAQGTFKALPVIASRAVRLGASASTVGFPNVALQGFAPKLAKGEVAALSGVQDDPRHFQISTPLQPGNSGGPLFDERGNVIGVIVAKLSARAALVTGGTLPENVNYAVKSSFLLGFLESVPEVAARLKDPSTEDRKFEDVVAEVEQAAALVLVD